MSLERCHRCVFPACVFRVETQLERRRDKGTNSKLGDESESFREWSRGGLRHARSTEQHWLTEMCVCLCVRGQQSAGRETGSAAVGSGNSGADQSSGG